MIPVFGVPLMSFQARVAVHSSSRREFLNENCGLKDTTSDAKAISRSAPTT